MSKTKPGLLKRIRARMLRTKLRTRLVACYIVIIIPVMLLGTVLYNISINEVERETREVSQQAVSQVGALIDERVTKLDGLILSAYTTTNIARYLRTTAVRANLSRDTMVKREAVYKELENWLILNPDLYSIAVASMDGDAVLVKQSGRDRTTADIAKGAYYEPLRTSTGQMMLLPAHMSQSYFTAQDNVITVGRKYLDTGTRTELGLMRYAGYILLEVRVDEIAQLCSDIKISENGFIEIYDSFGGLAYSSGQMPEEASEDDISVFHTSGLTGWTVTGIIPAGDLTARAAGIRDVFIALGVSGVILVVFASVFVAMGITKPIEKLQEAMASFEEGNLSVRVKTRDRSEVGLLTKSFNSLAENIGTLFVNIKKIERKKRDAEMETLYSQINPHFLYNTLDTIRMMAVLDENKEIEEALLALADLFRYSVRQKKDIVEIKAELQHAKNYMHLQNVRYQGQFEVRYDVEPDLLACKTLKLTLQPILENAIKHGLTQKPGDGSITVSIKREEERIAFSILDDGVGMDEEQLLELREALTSQAGEETMGLGLRNIHERLQLYFGPDSAIHIESAAGVGTTVSFSVPLFTDERSVLKDVIDIVG